jgi:hypothetical protein
LTVSFEFANAARVKGIILGLSSTEALGNDGIPVSVLKLGVEVFAAPIAHLVNRSLATGIVPAQFKVAITIPVYKGGGKPHDLPSFYPPVAILPHSPSSSRPSLRKTSRSI